MAKKKGISASPFVPVEEQPYSIPENWCWVKLSALSCMISKGTTPTGGKNAYIDTGVNFVRVENLNDDGTISHENIAHIAENVHSGFLKRSTLQENDILISIAGTLGKTGIVRDIDLPLNTNQALAFVRISSQEIVTKYIKSAIDSTIIQEILLGKTKVTSIPNLTLEIISNCPIPLSPVSEQQRIIDLIESLFAKLDEAKERAQAVVDGFELRKSAILHKAFTGELTERWRKEHGIQIESWKTKPLVEIASLQTGLMKGKRYEGETTFLPYLRVANVQDGFLDLTEIKEIEVSTSNVSRYLLKKGDVLFTEGGDFDKLGRGTVWEEEIPNCLHQNHIFVVRPHESALNSYFLSYQAGSKYGKTYFLSCSKQTTNLASINSTQLKGFPVKLPSLSEQLQIVSIIDDLIDRENQARIAAEAVLAQIDTMKKSILARAFRGELGTNDPTEESAAELLKSAAGA